MQQKEYRGCQIYNIEKTNNEMLEIKDMRASFYRVHGGNLETY